MKIRAVAASILLFIAACNPSGSNRGSRSEQLKLDNYFIAGKLLYEQNCTNCHQADGRGLAALYPPLYKSDFIERDPLAMICIIKKGLEGEIVVNGTSYNQKMPANPLLTDLELAEISTYVLNAWDDKYGLVPLDSVRVKLNACLGHN